MELLQLDAKLLYSAIINACHNLMMQREALNAINLFPVADGDTGNNMAATAEAIINHAVLQPTLLDTIKSIANAGILGARGNSGMIFSQFFNGFLEITLPDALNTEQFAALIQAACNSVRKAIANPVEGTILTVMDAWSLSLNQHAPTTHCFYDLLQKTSVDVENALQATTNMLAILQEAQVVDAGALGFSFFINGFSAYIANPKQVREIKDVMMINQQHQHELPGSGLPPAMRYCTEALLVGDAIDKEQLTHCLQQHGDSVVLTANQNLSRIHLHSNQPWQVFNALREIGKIQYPKVDDMLRQYQLLHAPKQKRIALVTDSSISIPEELFDYYQIHLITLNIHIDGHDLLDKYSLNSASFYEDLASSKTYPTTSCPAPALIVSKIAHLAEHYDEVLILSVSQALSGTYNAMFNAAKSFSNVHVINSRQVSGGLGLLATYAAELIADGLDINAIKALLETKINKTHLFIMVDQFDSLIRSGRVSRLKGKIAQFTGVKPIINMDNEGKIMLYGKAFNERKALIKLVSIITELSQSSGMDNYCIIHAGVPEKAKEFAQLTTEAFEREPAFIDPVSTVIGLHAGKGCIAIAALMN